MKRPTFPHYTDKELQIIRSNNAANILNYWRNIGHIYQETLRLYDAINNFTGAEPVTVNLDANIDATYRVVPMEIFGSKVDMECVCYSTTEQLYVDKINYLQEYYALSKEPVIAVLLNKDSITLSRAAIYSIVSRVWFEKNQQNPCFSTMDALGSVDWYAKMVLNDKKECNEYKQLVARIMFACHNFFLLEDKVSVREDIATFNHLFNASSPRLKRPIREYRNFGYTRKNMKVMVDTVDRCLTLFNQ